MSPRANSHLQGSKRPRIALGTLPCIVDFVLQFNIKYNDHVLAELIEAMIQRSLRLLYNIENDEDLKEVVITAKKLLGDRLDIDVVKYIIMMSDELTEVILPIFIVKNIKHTNEVLVIDVSDFSIILDVYDDVIP